MQDMVSAVRHFLIDTEAPPIPQTALWPKSWSDKYHHNKLGSYRREKQQVLH